MSDGDVALTLEGAGVRRAAAEQLLRSVMPLLQSTDPARRKLDIPDFCAAVRVGDQALAATTDGVGTKRALMGNRMADLGRDLVAYNVNDLAAVGIKPLAFLDYLSWGRLDVERSRELFEGMAAACREAGCILLGGETAEHPGIQAPNQLDLAGFAIGVGEVSSLVTGAAAAVRDPVIGIASTGPHASGFSLIRLAFARAGREVPASMLRPTPVYVSAVRRVQEQCEVRALSHICDGGLLENASRGLPDGLGAEFQWGGWPDPAWVKELRSVGCADDDLRRAVNMGIGFTIVVAPSDERKAIAVLAEEGHEAWTIGHVVTTADSGQPRHDA